MKVNLALAATIIYQPGVSIAGRKLKLVIPALLRRHCSGGAVGARNTRWQKPLIG